MTTEQPQRLRLLSGVQPSGKLHIGNYFGAIQQHIKYQDQGEAYYFIADFHALTTVNDAATLRSYIQDVALSYLALGLDPKKAVFFRQSDVPQVTELAWILSTVTGMGLLERAHAYKDKVARGIPAKVGLFYYPVLMAADILIYHPTHVPVGADQAQHVEMTRDMAGYFNSIYGEVLAMPECLVNEATKIVPGTDGQKMSKSYNNTIEIFAEGSALKKSVMGIVTDSTPIEAPKDPETNSIYQLYSLVATPEEAADMAEKFRAGGYGYGTAKKTLLEKLDAYFAPARARRKELEQNLDFVNQVLRDGAERAAVAAEATLKQVRQACGLI